MPSQFFIQQNDEVFGPVPSNVIKKSIATGKIQATDQIGSTSDGPWKQIGDLPALAKLCETPTTTVDTSDPPKALYCNVAGVKKQQKVLKDLPEKTRAALLREPKNEYDPNAIAVYVGGRRIGYVPTDTAETMAAVIDAGEWTYACPYMNIKWWDDMQIFIAEMSIERRRPGPSIIGCQHLPKAVRPVNIPSHFYSENF